MKAQRGLTTENEQFSSFIDNEVLVIREKQHIFHLTRDVGEIFSLYEYMDFVLSSKAYKALVMFARSEQNLKMEHNSFLSRILASYEPGLWSDQISKYLDRFLNVVNRYILSLSTLNSMTVFAGQGTVSLFSLNTGLAYDYRIVADDTVFENLNLDIGLVTKGSGYFLPRLLGIRKATEVLQWKSFTAEDALGLGLVDLIVPVSRLEEETMRFASGSEEHLSSTLLGIRKLFKCDIKELERSLELEDVLIKGRLKWEKVRRTFAANHENC
ncbi:MAG: enoyl-CoA hydratase-related protein [Syntrophobacteraceae bacterium]